METNEDEEQIGKSEMDLELCRNDKGRKILIHIILSVIPV